MEGGQHFNFLQMDIQMDHCPLLKGLSFCHTVALANQVNLCVMFFSLPHLG